jgi:peptide deformylase
LAGPQVGADLRLFGMKKEAQKGIAVMVNPQFKVAKGEEKRKIEMVTQNGEREDFLEGCLSFPNLWGTVRRYLKIAAEWQEIKRGKLVEKKEMLEGLEAIVFQHELDHLDGILFIDRIEEEGGKFYRSEGEKMVKTEVGEVLSQEKRV